ncbi:MAG: HAMP domain-containing sensor histidine kinase [Luteolibacter sp.]
MNLRFPLLSAIVLVPMVVLSTLAWRGAHMQRTELMNERREEARRLAEECALGAEKEVEAAAIPILNYPDPPIPQANDEWSRHLEAAKTVEDLRKLRDNPAAGLTSAGLPVRALAAFKILEKEDQAALEMPEGHRAVSQDEMEFDRLVAKETPSAATTLLLAKAKEMGIPSGFYGPHWQMREFDREWAARFPPDVKQWVGTSWLDNPKHLKTPPTWIPKLPALLKAPGWGIRPAIAGPDGYQYEDKPMAEQEVAGYPGLSIQITAPEAGALESGLVRQERLSLAMVGASIVTALVGLVLIHRTLARERRLNELKSHFVASVSHELRAPVGSVRLMADALDEGKVSPETAAEFHRLISREGKRLSHLIENILDFARIEQGRKRWRFEPTDVPALVTETIKLMAPLAAERKIELIQTPAHYEAEPVVDPDGIQQALINLLDNAIKFSPEGSRVEISLSNGGKHFLIQVRDHGPGIPAGEQQKIFERFYRSGNELRRETQGTGIGLSLVKAIAEAHRGRVELDSSPGTGSTFTLLIPIDATPGH